MINLESCRHHGGRQRGRHRSYCFDVSPQTASKWLNRLAPVPDRHKAEFSRMIGVRLEDLLPSNETETA